MISRPSEFTRAEFTKPAPCAWCEPITTDASVSHGICAKCFERATGRPPSVTLAAQLDETNKY
jgi:hypothetical protein